MSRPRELREALDSVDRQTFRDFEVVVADNSGDVEKQRAIDQVLAGFAHLPIRLVRHEKTLEAATNFNSMIDAARGKYWSCLPDDDRMCPTFLARSVGALEAHPECSFTFADHWIISADGTIDEARSAANSVTFGRTSLKEGIFRDEALFGVVLAQSPCLQTSLFRRDLLKSIRFIPNILALDLSLFLRLSTVAKSVSAYYIAERLMEYRIHSSQITATTDRTKLLETGIAALESVSSVPPEHRRRYRRKLGRQYMALALAEAEIGADAAARRHAVKSLSTWISARATVGAGLVVLAPRSVRLTRRLIARLRPGGRRTR